MTRSRMRWSVPIQPKDEVAQALRMAIQDVANPEGICIGKLHGRDGGGDFSGKVQRSYHPDQRSSHPSSNLGPTYTEGVRNESYLEAFVLKHVEHCMFMVTRVRFFEDWRGGRPGDPGTRIARKHSRSRMPTARSTSVTTPPVTARATAPAAALAPRAPRRPRPNPVQEASPGRT